MNKKNKKQEIGPIIKKIMKMYENYGIDVSNMAEEEFERIKDLYKQSQKDLDADLKKSEKYKGLFDEDIM